MTTTTIDCTPSPAATKRMLTMIIEGSSSPSDVDWAKGEMNRCFARTLCDGGAPVGAGFICRDGDDFEYSIDTWDSTINIVVATRVHDSVERHDSAEFFGLYWR